MNIAGTFITLIGHKNNYYATRANIQDPEWFCIYPPDPTQVRVYSRSGRVFIRHYKSAAAAKTVFEDMMALSERGAGFYDMDEYDESELPAIFEDGDEEEI